MNKKIFLSFIMIAFATVKLFAQQSISPSETTEFCPNVDVTFTVTLPPIADNTQPNLASWTNGPIIVSSLPRRMQQHLAL